MTELAPGPGLTCRLLLRPDGTHRVGLAFVLHNPGPQPVTIRYAEPFIGFALQAEAADGPVEIVQPAFSSGVQLRTESLGPDASVTITSPIELVFDAGVAPHGGDVSTRWSLAHEPARVRLTAGVEVDGAAVPPCLTWWDPAEPPTASGFESPAL